MKTKPLTLSQRITKRKSLKKETKGKLNKKATKMGQERKNRQGITEIRVLGKIVVVDSQIARMTR